MSVSTEHTKDILMGDGVNTKFPFTFQVIDKRQIRCLKVLASGEEVKVLNTEFGVKLNNEGANGGEISFPLIGDPLEEGTKFIIYRQTEIKQDYTPPNGQIFDAIAIKTEIDRLTMQNQEQEESIERAVKTSMGSSSTPEEYLDNVNEMLNNARVLQEKAVADCEQNIIAVTVQVALATTQANNASASAASAAASALATETIVSVFDSHAQTKTNAFNDNCDAKTAVVNTKVEEARRWAVGTEIEQAEGSSKYWANRAEAAANNAEVQSQSIYQDKVVLETPAIILQEKKCRYIRDVIAGDAFSIDSSAVKQLDKDITFELIIRMPTVVAFSLVAITSVWMGGNVPDLSEAGEHWFAFTSQDGGVTWRGSYEGRFVL